NGRLRLHIRHLYDHSPFARTVLDSAGLKPEDIRTTADLASLPVTRKEDIIRLQQQYPPYGGLLTAVAADVERVFISPGPVYEIQGSDTRWFSRALWAAGFRRGDVVINTFTYHLSPAGILMHEGLRDCGATVVVTGVGNTEIQLNAMRHLKVNGFIGTPSFLMALIHKAEEEGLDIKKDFYLERAWFTGEPLAPSVRIILEKEYAINTCQAYAVTEPGGAIAYECSAKQGLHLMDDYAVEIVDPESGRPVEPGETGEVVVTPVHNKTWGLIRFGTGDLSSLVTDACPCGRTAYRLSGIIGRTGDAVKIRGMFVVQREIDSIMSEYKTVKHYRLKVDRIQQRDRAVLEIAAGADLDTEEFKNRISRDFQSRCRLKLDGIDLVGESDFKEGYKKIEDTRRWE
ncbi:MAG: AMP-binding protein, partial [Dehalococcoidaceae bacterium]|nr:AMP-binding protein [Dehalococcoidaceae bacterium]